jgi:hypothetical protein
MIRVRVSYGLQNIVVFRLVGYSVWNGEATGSSPVYYTNWFVGVTANITDCLSDDKGSIPLRTAKLFGSAMASMSDFDSEDIGSSPIRTSDVVCPAVFAGMVKCYSVKVENRVRYPQTTNATWCNGNTFFSLSF